jgi:hypothetical protein
MQPESTVALLAAVRPRRRAVRSRTPTAAAALAALLVILAGGCSSSPPAASTGAQRVWIGTLHGDPTSHCLWLTGAGSDPVEVVLPADVVARFSPEVQLDSRQYGTLRAGETIALYELGATDLGRPGCPIPAGHRTILGEPQPWNGTTHVNLPTKTPPS